MMNAEELKKVVEDGQKALAALNTAASDSAIEARFKGAVDPLLDAKFAAATADFDTKYAAFDAELKAQKATNEALEARLARINELGEGKADQVNPLEAKHRSAFIDYVRKGDPSQMAHLIANNAEFKALVASNDQQAGYLLAPDTIDQMVSRIVTETSPVRQYASVQTISTSAWEKQINVGGSAATWEDADTDASAENTNPSYRNVRLTAHAARAVYHASPNLLDDARVNIEQEFANEMAISLAVLEGAAFVSGNGVNRPRGFLSYTNTITGSYAGAWETVEYRISGAAGAFLAAGSAPEAVFIDTIHSLKAPYKANARFYMARQTMGAVRKIRDADGRPLFQWDGTQPATVAGENFALLEDMPAIADDAYSIAYGDLGAAYQIVDRAGMTVLRDPYSSKPQVEFFGRKRLGGGIKMFEALKLIRMAD